MSLMSSYSMGNTTTPKRMPVNTKWECNYCKKQLVLTSAIRKHLLEKHGITIKD